MRTRRICTLEISAYPTVRISLSDANLTRILTCYSLTRDYALDFLLQGRIASNTGTSSIFDARHDGDRASHSRAVHSLEDLPDLRCALEAQILIHALKNRWSTRIYYTSAFHDETLMSSMQKQTEPDGSLFKKKTK